MGDVVGTEIPKQDDSQPEIKEKIDLDKATNVGAAEVMNECQSDPINPEMGCDAKENGRTQEGNYEQDGTCDIGNKEVPHATFEENISCVIENEAVTPDSCVENDISIVENGLQDDVLIPNCNVLDNISIVDLCEEDIVKTLNSDIELIKSDTLCLENDVVSLNDNINASDSVDSFKSIPEEIETIVCSEPVTESNVEECSDSEIDDNYLGEVTELTEAFNTKIEEDTKTISNEVESVDFSIVEAVNQTVLEASTTKLLEIANASNDDTLEKNTNVEQCCSLSESMPSQGKKSTIAEIDMVGCDKIQAEITKDIMVCTQVAYIVSDPENLLDITSEFVDEIIDIVAMSIDSCSPNEKVDILSNENKSVMVESGQSAIIELVQDTINSEVKENSIPSVEAVQTIINESIDNIIPEENSEQPLPNTSTTDSLKNKLLQNTSDEKHSKSSIKDSNIVSPCQRSPEIKSVKCIDPIVKALNISHERPSFKNRIGSIRRPKKKNDDFVIEIYESKRPSSLVLDRTVHSDYNNGPCSLTESIMCMGRQPNVYNERTDGLNQTANKISSHCPYFSVPHFSSLDHINIQSDGRANEESVISLQSSSLASDETKTEPTPTCDSGVGFHPDTLVDTISETTTVEESNATENLSLGDKKSECMESDDTSLPAIDTSSTTSQASESSSGVTGELTSTGDYLF